MSKSKIINAYDKIRELKLIESIPYTELIKFLILFTEIEIAPLSNGNDPKIDLDYAKRFLSGKITAKNYILVKSMLGLIMKYWKVKKKVFNV